MSKTKKILIISVSAILAFFLVVNPIAAVIVYESIFGMRYEPESWRTFSAADFDSLTATELDIHEGGERITAYKYKNPTVVQSGVVIVAHGLGGEALHSLFGISAAHTDVETLGSLDGIVGQLDLANDLSILGGSGGYTVTAVGVDVVLALEAAAGVGAVLGAPVAQLADGVVRISADDDLNVILGLEGQAGIRAAAASGEAKGEGEDGQQAGQGTDDGGFHNAYFLSY